MYEYIVSNGWVVDELESTWKEGVMAQLKYHPEI
jgi:hypothetical protein